MDAAESSDEETAASDAKRVVVAWWKDDIGGLLGSLAAFAPRGSIISIIAEEEPEAGGPSLLHILFTKPGAHDPAPISLP